MAARWEHATAVQRSACASAASPPSSPASPTHGVVRPPPAALAPAGQASRQSSLVQPLSPTAGRTTSRGRRCAWEARTEPCCRSPARIAAAAAEARRGCGAEQAAAACCMPQPPPHTLLWSRLFPAWPPPPAVALHSSFPSPESIQFPLLPRSAAGTTSAATTRRSRRSPRCRRSSLSSITQRWERSPSLPACTHECSRSGGAHTLHPGRGLPACG